MSRRNKERKAKGGGGEERKGAGERERGRKKKENNEALFGKSGLAFYSLVFLPFEVGQISMASPSRSLILVFTQPCGVGGRRKRKARRQKREKQPFECLRAPGWASQMWREQVTAQLGALSGFRQVTWPAVPSLRGPVLFTLS